MVRRWIICLISLVLTVGFSRGLYFHIGETDQKCFMEEVPAETMIVGKYKTQLYESTQNQWLPSSPGIGMHVEIKNPEHKTMLSRHYAAEGKFTFTSHDAGEHYICIGTNTTRWFGGNRLRVHLEISIGESAIDYAQVAAKEKLGELQLRIRQLLDQIEQITKEQSYQRAREERFRMVSDSTNARVLWWSLGQAIILILMGIWQMRHLKSFFEAKKLV